MGSWDGFGYSTPNSSTGGCSSLGLDAQGKFGLVYKATTKTGGIYRRLSRHKNAPSQLITPMTITTMSNMGTYTNIPNLIQLFNYHF